MKILLLLLVLSGATFASFDSGALLLHVFAYVACGLLALYAALVGALLAAERRMRHTPVRRRTLPARHSAIAPPAP